MDIIRLDLALVLLVLLAVDEVAGEDAAEEEGDGVEVHVEGGDVDSHLHDPQVTTVSPITSCADQCDRGLFTANYGELPLIINTTTQPLTAQTKLSRKYHFVLRKYEQIHSMLQTSILPVRFLLSFSCVLCANNVSLLMEVNPCVSTFYIGVQCHNECIYLLPNNTII